jgi:siderophore synthetase component
LSSNRIADYQGAPLHPWQWRQTTSVVQAFNA